LSKKQKVEYNRDMQHANWFGLLVAFGVLLGRWYVLKRSREYRLNVQEMEVASLVAVNVGFVFAHVFEVVFYAPARMEREGVWVLFKFWDGISSYGGFLGALIGLWGYFAWKKKSWWRQADAIIEGLVYGWVFGRLGCTVVFDHPGPLTDFVLGMNYRDGIRHNLGLYEFLYTLLVLVPATFWIRSRERRGRAFAPGSSVFLISVLYAPVRFALDFLRAEDLSSADKRYGGLTPAHYMSLALLVFSVVGFAWQRKRSS
jgi:phosphatidylglycerol:prolipoprotein diacylglycerol transferase